MRRLAALATASALALAAAGCGSAPPSRFYTLTAVPAGPAASSNVSVVLGPVLVPAAIDRPQMVLTVGPNQVRLDEFNRWAAPLANDIARVVAENLAAMLGTPRVAQSPLTLTPPIDYLVAIEVQRFDSAPGEAATLDAVWTVKQTKDGASRTGRTTAREPTADQSIGALAIAHSRAASRLSRDIADAVQALGAGG